MSAATPTYPAALTFVSFVRFVFRPLAGAEAAAGLVEAS